MVFLHKQINHLYQTPNKKIFFGLELDLVLALKYQSYFKFEIKYLHRRPHSIFALELVAEDLDELSEKVPVAEICSCLLGQVQVDISAEGRSKVCRCCSGMSVAKLGPVVFGARDVGGRRSPGGHHAAAGCVVHDAGRLLLSLPL